MSTFLSCAFREQEDGQATLPILLRPRIPGVQDQHGCSSCPPRPPRLNQASVIAAEALMNNVGEEGISEGFRLAKSERAVPGCVGAEGPCHPTTFLEHRLYLHSAGSPFIGVLRLPCYAAQIVHSRLIN
jgi:hypothetical protein